MIRDQLWIDRPDALERIATAEVELSFKQVAIDLINDGVSVLPGWHDVGTCAQLIADYNEWCERHPEVVAANRDSLGHEKRLCNFHHYSPAALSIGQNPRVMQLLDFLFGREAGIYTSLTFKYGTQQPAHRDTPHFATWPASHYFGVWTALEDVNPDAGPLFYHENAHRFAAEPAQFWQAANEQRRGATQSECCFLALDLYNGFIIQEAGKRKSITPEMKTGDIVIWHPQTPHGGTLAKDPDLTRWSIVFHCAPIDVQVHQYDRFFTHQSAEAPPSRYGFVKKGNRKVAWAGDVAFM
jgi:phytanoyl-CoA hydroxylase